MKKDYVNRKRRIAIKRYEDFVCELCKEAAECARSNNSKRLYQITRILSKKGKGRKTAPLSQTSMQCATPTACAVSIVKRLIKSKRQRKNQSASRALVLSINPPIEFNSQSVPVPTVLVSAPYMILGNADGTGCPICLGNL